MRRTKMRGGEEEQEEEEGGRKVVGARRCGFKTRTQHTGGLGKKLKRTVDVTLSPIFLPINI